MYAKYLKRLLDIILSFLGLLVLFPLLLILAVIIKIDSPGKILFWQKRIGMHKVHFMMPKFRTMRSDTPSDIPTHLLNDPDKYITSCGKIMRKFSLDELPQIWCILTGKMSVIGPRPALWNQFDLITERDKYSANDLRPGLSGWAQVNGRDTLPIPQKAFFDGEYASKVSFSFDLKCFYLTIIKVLTVYGVVEGNPQNKNAEVLNEENSNHRT